MRKGFKKLANILIRKKGDMPDKNFGRVRERMMSSNLRKSRYINDFRECLIIFYYVKSGVLGHISRVPSCLKFLKTPFFTPSPHTTTPLFPGGPLP